MPTEFAINIKFEGNRFFSWSHYSGFIRHRRSENSPSTTQNSPAKFHLFPEKALLFHNNYPVTLHCSPATTIIILNENPDYLNQGIQKF